MPIAWADNNRLAKLLLFGGTDKHLQLFFKKNTFLFGDRKKSTTFALAIKNCPDGGIGRRAGLKHQWGNPSRFDPGSGY